MITASGLLGYKLCTPEFGDFLPLFSADPLQLCQVGWGRSVDSHVQVSPEMLDWVQVRLWPLKDIHRVVCHSCFGCVLRVIVLLEGEHLAQSEELSASDQIQVGVRSSLSPSPSLSLPATFCLVFTGLSIKG